MDASTRPPLSPDAIINAAEQLIGDTGSTDWSVRSLSRLLECAPGALYRHFPGGVTEIDGEIRTRDFARLEEGLDAAEDDIDAPGLPGLNPRSHAARLTRRCHGYLDFAKENPAIYQHLFGHLRSDHKPDPAGIVERAMIERPAALIRNAAKSRELTRPVIGHGEATQIAEFLWVQLHGFADLRISGVGGGRLEELEIRLLVNLLNLAGFAIASTPAGLEAAARSALENPADRKITARIRAI